MTVVLVACGNPLGSGTGVDTNFTPGFPFTGASPAPAPSSLPPPPSFHFSQGMKIAPGAVSAVGAQTAASVAVTVTQRTATSAHTSGVFSINQFQSR